MYKIFFHLFFSYFICLSFVRGQDPEDDFKVRVISSHAEHVQALEQAFQKAKKDILVTNYGQLYNGPGGLLSKDLFKKYIPEARKRGVNIYFRLTFRPEERQNQRYPDFPQAVEQYLEDQNIQWAEIDNHAKIVMVDRRLLMIGSFNWLTDFTARPEWQSTLNRTLVLESERDLIHDKAKELIWNALKYYRNKPFTLFGHHSKPELRGPFNPYNQKAAYQLRRNLLEYPIVSFPLKDESEIALSAAVEGHRILLLESFENAKERITIFSPFVTEVYRRDFTQSLLEEVLKRGVYVNFVCLPENEPRLSQYMDHLSKSYAHLKILSAEIHTKTIIVDDDFLMEGSFNWLQTARDEMIDYNKNEAVICLKGNEARCHVRNFYETELGKTILSSKAQNLLPAPEPSLECSDFFKKAFYDLEKDIWVHLPLWVQHNNGYHYMKYHNYYKIMSGNNYRRPGQFCCAINQDYIVNDRGEILYFNSVEDAKGALFDVLEGEDNNASHAEEEEKKDCSDSMEDDLPGEE